MADSKITALTAISTVDPAADVLPIVDVSDTSMAASGTTKKITSNQILGAGGTATLASATITGDLTVDTSTLKVDSTNNRVGVNTTNLTNDLTVQTSTAKGGIHINFAGSTFGLIGLVDPGVTSNNTIIGSVSNNSLELMTNNSTKATLDSSGNLGLGVTPSAWNTSYKAFQFGYGSAIYSGNTAFPDFTNISANMYVDSTGALKYLQNGAATRYQQYAGIHSWYNESGTKTAGATFTATQAMTLDASGNLLVGKTASSTTVAGAQIQPDGTFSAVKGDANPGFFYNRSTAASGTIALFRSNSVTVGSITQDGTNTSYVTTSDYRLKENVQPLVGGLARISALKPSIYKWKSNGSNGEGFIAHELAEVVPAAVTGQKDAVNADGTINAQGVDLSKVVPVLVAAIQELASEVNALKNA